MPMIIIDVIIAAAMRVCVCLPYPHNAARTMVI